MNLIATLLLWITYIISLYISLYWILVFVSKRGNLSLEEKKKQPLLRYPFVSVLIPAYNEQDTIIPSLESVIHLDYPKNKFEIIVINDGSKDNTPKRVKEFIKRNGSFDIRLINQTNQGKANSINNALKIAKGEFFACLDADSFVDKLTLKKMLKVFEMENKNLTIVTPAMKVSKPKNFLQRIQALEYIVSLFISRLMSHLNCIYVAPGPFSLYRVKTIKRMGGFDTDTITEDQEIAYRAQKHHYRIKQCYDAYVYTVAPKNLRGLYKQRNRWLKGSILNILKYKKLLWNKEYGDFGVMQMSMNIIIFLISLSTLAFFSIFFLKPIYEFIRNLYLFNFNIKLLALNFFDFNLRILNFDLEKIIILYLLFIVSFTLIYFSYRNANETFKKKNIIVLLGYFIVYYVLISFIILVIFFEMLVGKKAKWRF